jgi:DNA-binding transcriptional MerR regulator
MEYRVDQLAAACDVSVDTVRYYQAQRLLPAPRRQGRVAWYGEEHAERIRRVRVLRRQGLTLAAIRRVVAGEAAGSASAAADLGLAAAVAAARADEDDEEFLTLEEMARRSGVPAPLLQALERAGVQLGRTVEGETFYTGADVAMVSMALRLLDAGLPLTELLALARDHHLHVRAVAERAVELFDEHVRRPARATAVDEAAATERLVATFRELYPAVTALVAHHFRRVLLTVAEEHIERVGDAAEVAATRAETRRRLEAPWPA